LHKRPPSSCIDHARSINPPPYRLTPRARNNLIWPLPACRSCRMKKLDFIAACCCCVSRDSVCPDRHTVDAQLIFNFLARPWPLVAPLSLSQLSKLQPSPSPGIVFYAVVWPSEDQNSSHVKACGLPCGHRHRHTYTLSLSFCVDDPFHKTFRCPDKGAVGTLRLPVLQSISPSHLTCISHPAARATVSKRGEGASNAMAGLLHCVHCI
jgi:hypothetical protein